MFIAVQKRLPFCTAFDVFNTVKNVVTYYNNVNNVSNAYNQPQKTLYIKKEEIKIGFRNDEKYK